MSAARAIPTARKVPATAPVLLKNPVEPFCCDALFRPAPVGPIVFTSTVRYVVCPTTVTTEVRVMRLPTASVVGINVVEVEVNGAVEMRDSVVVTTAVSVIRLLGSSVADTAVVGGAGALEVVDETIAVVLL